MQSGPTRKAERHAATRAALLGAARALFTGKGYAETGTEDVVRRAEVTRGALYYHFADKAALFEGVLEEIAGEVAAVVGRAAQARDEPLDALRAGCLAFLDAALDPAVRRIYLVDAPAVLGWKRWRELDARYFNGALRHGIAAVLGRAEAGSDPPIEAAAHLLAGALNEAALWLAEGGDRAAARQTLDAFLTGLRQQASNDGARQPIER